MLAITYWTFLAQLEYELTGSKLCIFHLPTVQVTFANGESLDAAEIVTIPCKIKDEETDLEMLSVV